MRGGTESCFHYSSQDEPTCLSKNANANNHLGHLHLEQEKKSYSANENYWDLKANLF